MKKYISNIFTIEEILPYVETGPKIIKVRDKYRIKVSSKTLKLFKRKGLFCVRCGLEGTFFIIGKNKGAKYYSPQLATLKNFKLILFTKDHIQPSSKGGSNRYKNLQVLCENCNQQKGTNNINYNKAMKNIEKHIEKEIYRLLLVNVGKMNINLFIKQVKKNLIEKWLNEA